MHMAVAGRRAQWHHSAWLLVLLRSYRAHSSSACDCAAVSAQEGPGGRPGFNKMRARAEVGRMLRCVVGGGC